MQGWFKINRKLSDNPLWTLEPFTKGQAWVDLIMLANFTKGFLEVRGNILPVERGQVGWSEISLAKRWKWSRNKVRRYLKWLKTEQQIEQQANHLSSIITIVNYEKYQTDDTTNDTTEGQQKDNRRTTDDTLYKKDKKKKKKKKKKNDKNNSLATIISFKKNKDKILNEALKLYPNKNCKKAIEDFIDYCEINGKTYKRFELAYFRWVREDNYNQYKITKPRYVSPVVTDTFDRKRGMQKPSDILDIKRFTND